MSDDLINEVMLIKTSIKNLDTLIKAGLDEELISKQSRRQLIKETKKVLKTLETYQVDEREKDKTRIYEWIETINIDDVEGDSVSDAYGSYVDFCKDNHYRPLSKTMFSRFMRKLFGLGTKVTYERGKYFRTYYKISNTFENHL